MASEIRAIQRRWIHCKTIGKWQLNKGTKNENSILGLQRDEYISAFNNEKQRSWSLCHLLLNKSLRVWAKQRESSTCQMTGKSREVQRRGVCGTTEEFSFEWKWKGCVWRRRERKSLHHYGTNSATKIDTITKDWGGNQACGITLFRKYDGSELQEWDSVQ